MILRALVLAFVLALASCGALRWVFAPGANGEPSPAQSTAATIAENGTDPGKWIGWLIGGFVTAGAGVGFAGGRYVGRERRSGRDRRVAPVAPASSNA